MAGIGSGMLMAPPRDPAVQTRETEAARAKRDIAFSPLAMPMLSGPGAIAVTLGFTSLATDWTDYVAIILGILVVAAIIYSTLRVSSRIVQVIGLTGMNAFAAAGSNILAANPAGGIHHLCFEVADLQSAARNLTAAGARIHAYLADGSLALDVVATTPEGERP